jgi:hypothetical protein
MNDESCKNFEKVTEVLDLEPLSFPLNKYVLKPFAALVLNPNII